MTDSGNLVCFVLIGFSMPFPGPDPWRFLSSVNIHGIRATNHSNLPGAEDLPKTCDFQC